MEVSLRCQEGEGECAKRGRVDPGRRRRALVCTSINRFAVYARRPLRVFRDGTRDRQSLQQPGSGRKRKNFQCFRLILVTIDI